MTEFFVDVRCLVEARDIGDAYNKVVNELYEYLMNSDVIEQHDYLKVEQRRDDFYD